MNGFAARIVGGVVMAVTHGTTRHDKAYTCRFQTAERFTAHTSIGQGFVLTEQSDMQIHILQPNTVELAVAVQIFANTFFGVSVTAE